MTDKRELMIGKGIKFCGLHWIGSFHLVQNNVYGPYQNCTSEIGLKHVSDVRAG